MHRTDTLEEQAAVHPWLRWRLTHESQLPNVAPESDDDLALLRSQCASDPLRIHLATRFSLAEDTMHRRQTGPAARRSTRSWAGSSTSSRSEASGIEHSSSSQVRSDPLFSTGRGAELSPLGPKPVPAHVRAFEQPTTARNWASITSSARLASSMRATGCR